MDNDRVQPVLVPTHTHSTSSRPATPASQGSPPSQPSPSSQPGPSSGPSFDPAWRFPVDPSYENPPIDPAREWPSLKPPPTPRLSTATTPEWEDADSDSSDLEPILTPAASSVSDADELPAHEAERRQEEWHTQWVDKLTAIASDDCEQDGAAEEEEEEEKPELAEKVEAGGVVKEVVRRTPIGFHSLDEDLLKRIGILVLDAIRVDEEGPNGPFLLTTDSLDRSTFSQPPVTRVCHGLRNLLLPEYYGRCFQGLTLTQPMWEWPRRETEFARFLAGIPWERRAMLKGVQFRILSPQPHQEQEYFRMRHELNELLGEGWGTAMIPGAVSVLARVPGLAGWMYHHAVQLRVDVTDYPGDPNDLGLDDEYPGRGRTRYRRAVRNFRRLHW